MCTHGNTHLADGMVAGTVVECSKHNGRFDVITGEPRRLPACIALRTYVVRENDGRVWLNVASSKARVAPGQTLSLRVVSNQNVATFIKELVLAPVTDGDWPAFRAGQYLQLQIPAYGHISFRDFDVVEPYASVWQANHLYDLAASNALVLRRNYSLATNPASSARELRFNVRIATPPHGQDCGAGAGSSYVYRLKPGDLVTASGPFGDFLIRDGDREMVYVGGGAGMAPLRSHLLYLFETARTTRKVCVLVRRAVAAGGFLRRRVPRSGSQISELPLPHRALGATARRRVDWPDRVHSRRAPPRTAVTARQSEGRRVLRLWPAGHGQSHARHAAARIRRGAAGHRGG